MNDFIGLIANVSLSLSFVVALVFGIAQVRVAARDRRERLGLEALRNFQSREFAELLYHITMSKMPKTYAELQVLSEHEQVMFIQLSQQMEMLGLQVAGKLIDISLVDRTLGSFVVTAWEKYKVLFEDMRAAIPDPYLGEYFQSLAERIQKEMKENPREPFYKSVAR
jgi:hypothetical protein